MGLFENAEAQPVDQALLCCKTFLWLHQEMGCVVQINKLDRLV